MMLDLPLRTPEPPLPIGWVVEDRPGQGGILAHGPKEAGKMDYAWLWYGEECLPGIECYADASHHWDPDDLIAVVRRLQHELDKKGKAATQTQRTRRNDRAPQ
jgi:hypothetical protein